MIEGHVRVTGVGAKRGNAPAGIWRIVMMAWRRLVLAILALAALAAPALAQIVVSPPSLGPATAGLAYSETIVASGGTGPYEYTITGGALPAGLSLSLGGEITGTPTAVGAYNFSLQARDSASFSTTQPYTITVLAPTLTLSPGPGALPDGAVGVPYFQTFTASGGTAPYTYDLTGSNLGGLGFNTATGTLSGTRPSGGVVNFNVSATDSTGGGTFTVVSSYSINFAAAPAVTSVLVPASGVYGVGISGLDRLTFEVQFDQAVTVSRTPALPVIVGSTTQAANYVSGSGTSVLTFSYVIQAGDLDTDGVVLGGGIALNGGTIRSLAGADAVTTLNSVGATNGVLVDGVLVIANDDAVSTMDNVPVTGNVLTNDIGRDLSASLVVAPVNGTMVLNADGSFTYTPNRNFSGTDTFESQTFNNLYADNSITTIAIGITPANVTGVSPNSGPMAGGTSVTISGSGFTQVDDVLFGGVAASSFTVNSASSITAVVPPATAGGAVDVAVVKGSVSGTLANGYTYLAPGGLSVADSGGFTALGPVGGPFAPPSKTWTLSNTGGAAISVEVVAPGGVFELSGATSGTPFTLPPAATVDITLSLNAGANALPPGTVSGPITFFNHTNGIGNDLRAAILDVWQAEPGLTLSSSANPAQLGEAVSLTAVLNGGANPGGTVSFRNGGTLLGSVPVSGGQAVLNLSNLPVGTHAITAVYSGDGNNIVAVSPVLNQVVAALGSVTIRQETSGSDAVFGFRSATAGLNVAVATVNGVGQSAAIALPAGSYAVTGDDMGGAGYALTGLACNDGNSVGDVASRTANIELTAGEAVICTFTSVNSAEATTALIEDFLESRARLILANAPDEQRRFDRLNGRASGGSSVGSALLGYLPGVVEGGPVGISTSLGAIEAMAGNQQPGAFDAWFEGTFSLFEGDGARDRFNSAAFGADYLLNPDLLVGGFVQFDHLSRRFADDAATLSGSGWLAGPYVTARLSDNLYLDLLAAGGQSGNRISPDGSYEDRFDATRYLLSAALEGQWTHENWTFSPRMKLSYFEETSDFYVDSLGVDIPGVTVGLGQLAVGPGIGYRLTLDSGVVVDLGLRAEGVLEIANAGGLELGDFSGRLSGTIGFGLVGGANIGLSARLDGLGAGDGTAGSFGVTLSLPAR